MVFYLFWWPCINQLNSQAIFGNWIWVNTPFRQIGSISCCIHLNKTFCNELSINGHSGLQNALYNKNWPVASELAPFYAWVDKYHLGYLGACDCEDIFFVFYHCDAEPRHNAKLTSCYLAASATLQRILNMCLAEQQNLLNVNTL